eukprot:TRINITY_DN19291_c0_g1_i1.p1 TRINITY_DN19291_c0_g1~~TRINITY_DN19291_c0_g1_i1.p1  ORF type:complete len:841 (-),score=133.50 TRINITY_DN19291_c0_g1_i1:1980-4502(-)
MAVPALSSTQCVRDSMFLSPSLHSKSVFIRTGHTNTPQPCLSAQILTSNNNNLINKKFRRGSSFLKSSFCDSKNELEGFGHLNRSSAVQGPKQTICSQARVPSANGSVQTSVRPGDGVARTTRSGTQKLVVQNRPSGGGTQKLVVGGRGMERPGMSREGRRREAEERVLEAEAAARAVAAPVYSVAGLTALYADKPWQVLGRTLRISFTLGSVVAAILVDRATGRIDQNMRLRARQLRRGLASLGPTFVKLGQALSTRPDLLPPAYLDEFALLQDQLETFSDKEAFALIENELGLKMEDIFASITPQPIAAASLGQVYKATLRSDNRTVAVKVQRPGIVTAIGLDFFLLRGITVLVDKYVDTLTTNVSALLDDFATRVYQELNYVQEARNARRFGQLYGGRSDIVVPLAEWRFTSTRVLVMDWIDGIKLSDAAQMSEQNLDVISLVNIGIQCSLRQLLEHGYFHADPHPGNLLATSDGRLAFLDFGMMSETPAQARLAIIGHVVHLVNRDYEAMAKDYYALDFLAPEVDVKPIVPALQSFFDDVLTQTVSELNFRTIVDGLGAVLYQYPFNVPAYYALILRSLTVLEGLALYTDPNFKVLAAAYPYMAKRLLTDTNPYLRDSLIELLFKDGTFRWLRLENLLTQGRRDQDFEAGAVMQPLLSLLLGPDGGPLRRLVEDEAVRVVEALLLGGAIHAASQNSPLPSPLTLPAGLGGLPLPEPVRQLFLLHSSPTAVSMALALRSGEQQALLELRTTVLSCVSLLAARGAGGAGGGFDPRTLQPVLEILQQRSAQEMMARIASGVLQRLSARALQMALRPTLPPALPASSPATAGALPAPVAA